jgi:hypothetical protein
MRAGGYGKIDEGGGGLPADSLFGGCKPHYCHTQKTGPQTDEKALHQVAKCPANPHANKQASRDKKPTDCPSPLGLFSLFAQLPYLLPGLISNSIYVVRRCQSPLMLEDAGAGKTGFEKLLASKPCNPIKNLL